MRLSILINRYIHISIVEGHAPDVLDVMGCHKMPCPKIQLEVLYDVNRQYLPVLIVLSRAADIEKQNT